MHQLEEAKFELNVKLTPIVNPTLNVQDDARTYH
jgi:hypothetical protein